jgi:ribosomal protein L9
MSDRRALDEKLVAERIGALAEEKVIIKKKVNEKGHLYDAVDSAEVAAAAGLPEDVIRLEKPFREAGTFDVPVAYGEQFGKFAIIIEAE